MNENVKEIKYRSGITPRKEYLRETKEITLSDKDMKEFVSLNKDRKRKGLTPWSKKRFLIWKKDMAKGAAKNIKKYGGKVTKPGEETVKDVYGRYKKYKKA